MENYRKLVLESDENTINYLRDNKDIIYKLYSIFVDIDCMIEFYSILAMVEILQEDISKECDCFNIKDDEYDLFNRRFEEIKVNLDEVLLNLDKKRDEYKKRIFKK